MSDYYISITIQTDNKEWSSGGSPIPGGGVIPGIGGYVRDHALDEGTYVELENTGVSCQIEAPHSESKMASIFPAEIDEKVGDLLPMCTFDVNRTGRNLVLLAVPGASQVFDHWEGNACAGQGSRCETAEPPASVPGYSVKAVFKRTAEPASHAQRLDPDRKSRLVSDALRDPPRK